MWSCSSDSTTSRIVIHGDILNITDDIIHGSEDLSEVEVEDSQTETNVFDERCTPLQSDMEDDCRSECSDVLDMNAVSNDNSAYTYMKQGYI